MLDASRGPTGESIGEMPYEEVYEHILARVEREELNVKCQEVAQREVKLVKRRIRGAQRALQHAYDVEAARQRLPLATGNSASAAAMIKDLTKLQSKIASRMQKLARCVSAGSIPSNVEKDQSIHDTVKVKAEPEASQAREIRDDETGEAQTPTKRKHLKRRLSREMLESPRKPPRPGRLANFDEVNFEKDEDEDLPQGPHAMPMPTATDDDETEDDVPIELDVSDSDTEFELAVYLEKARHLRQISSERRVGELPGLIGAVLAEIERYEWATMPRELLETLSATLGAATTLKPTQRRQLHTELTNLQAVTAAIDATTSRRYPTLLGSKARFLSSMDDASEEPEVHSSTTASSVESRTDEHTIESSLTSIAIEDLHTATAELARRTIGGAEELKSMKQIEELLRLVDHVFDNPTLARSRQYSAVVARSLDTLIGYVDAIPRTTRRKLQCEDQLRRRRAQITGVEV